MPWTEKSTKTIRVPLPADGEWVDIKDKLSMSERFQIKKAIIRAQRVTADGLTELDAGELYDAAQFSTLDVAIVAWSSSLPVTKANIREMDDEMIAAITAACNEQYPAERTDGEKNDSSESTPPLSIIRDDIPTDSAGSA